jgi:hypothetical protein
MRWTPDVMSNCICPKLAEAGVAGVRGRHQGTLRSVRAFAFSLSQIQHTQVVDLSLAHASLHGDLLGGSTRASPLCVHRARAAAKPAPLAKHNANINRLLGKQAILLLLPFHQPVWLDFRLQGLTGFGF